MNLVSKLPTIIIEIDYYTLLIDQGFFQILILILILELSRFREFRENEITQEGNVGKFYHKSRGKISNFENSWENNWIILKNIVNII